MGGGEGGGRERGMFPWCVKEPSNEIGNNTGEGGALSNATVKCSLTVAERGDNVDGYIVK
jgi:hypothetical protein